MYTNNNTQGNQSSNLYNRQFFPKNNNTNTNSNEDNLRSQTNPLNYSNYNQSNQSDYNNLNNVGISSPLQTENNINNNMLPSINKSSGFANRGKTVLGIQPLTQPLNYQDELRKDELTKRKFDEINSNIDVFRTELTNTLRRINKNQSKLKVDTVIDEITDFKNVFIDSLQAAERKKEQENDFLLKEIKELREDVRRNYEESKNNYKIIRGFQDDIFEFEKEITNRVLRMEKNQADQFDKIYGLINNLTLLKQHGQSKGRDVNSLVDKELNNKDDKYERGGEEDMIAKLKQTQLSNIELEHQTNSDNKGLYDKGKTTDLKDAYRIKALEERQKAMPVVKHKINQTNLNQKLKTKSKLLSFIRLGQAYAKFKTNREFAIDSVKIEALEFFINNYKKCTATLFEWVKNAIKVPVNSVKQVETLELDLSEHTIVGNNPTQETKDIFQRLKARIQGIVENLGTHLYSHPLDVQTMTWMRIPITSNYIVPYGFYYNFVLSRIYLAKGEIVGLDDRHILSILSVYVIIDVVIGKILLEEMKNTKSSTVRKNFKMIASALYHSLIKYIKEKMQICTKYTNYAEFIKKQCKESPQLDIKFDKNSSVFYRQALKSYYSKVEKKQLEIRSKARFQLDKVENEFHVASKDNNPNDIWEIGNYLYSERQMQSYFKLAETNNFKLAYAILNWAQQFKSFIYTTEG